MDRSIELCAPDLQNRLFAALEQKNFDKFERILKTDVTNSQVDVDFWYGDPDYVTLLDLACSSAGNSQFVKALLKYGAQPNQLNKVRKKGPIHFAVELADVETVESLLDNPKTDINLTDNTGSSALHIAAKLGKTDIVNVLLQHPQIDVNIVNRKSQTPLHLAVMQENEDTVVTLIKRSDIDLDEIKSISGKSGRELIADKFPQLESTLRNIESQSSNKENNDDANNLFLYLYRHDTSSFISKIKHNKDNLNKHDGRYTYLQYACDFGLRDVVESLLHLGANPNNCCSTNNQTPIMIAAFRGYVNIIRTLVKYKETSYEPINGETVIHSIINGLCFPEKVVGSSEEERDYYKSLKYLLTSVPSDSLNINQRDVKGNTALHYAAKLEEKKIILLLLKHGAYIGQKNILGEPALINIPFKVLEQYLDDCITTNDKLPREDNYEIIFNYNFLVPPKHSIQIQPSMKRLSQISVELDQESEIEETPSLCETNPLLSMSKLPELKPLLKHPVLASFVNLKWYSIRKLFYINLLFYLTFWSLLTVYILSVYGAQKINNMESTNQTDLDQTHSSDNNSYKFDYSLWILTCISLAAFILRELFQLSATPLEYVTNFENWLEIGLIVVTGIILLDHHSYSEMRHQISAIAILLSWTELVLLVGRHPLLSTNIEMFKTVCFNFLKFLSWYSIFILAFALSFYMLFREDSSKDEENFFHDPAISVFKSVVMLTGEFDASSIPFSAHPGTSHILFVLFVFLIAIVLFNLLNGLAVSDTQAIKADAELVSYISRVKLISYIESMATADPIPRRRVTCNCCCVPVKRRRHSHRRKHLDSVSKRVNLFPNLLVDNEVRVLPNQECKVAFSNVNKVTVKRQEEDTSCFQDCGSWYIDPAIVKVAKIIIAEKKERDERMSTERNYQLLIEYKDQLHKYEEKLNKVEKTSDHMLQMLTEMMSVLNTKL